MAVQQPLTAFSNRIDDATLRGVDIDAPRIRSLQRALDACALESGPQRFEMARRATPEHGPGAFYLMGEAPSPALTALFKIAPGARERFAARLALSRDDETAQGALRLEEVRCAPCDPRTPMDVFLRMLAQSATVSPSSIEPLFEDLEQARINGLIEIDTDGLTLTGTGRDMMRSAGPVMDAFDDSAARIDLHAQEVADGRMSLGQAIAALGAHLGVELPPPGRPDLTPAMEATPDAAGRIDTSLFDPLLEAAQSTPYEHRAAVMVMALHRRLTEWGLSNPEAESLLRHDIRCLRAFGASLSHGAMRVHAAQEVAARAAAGLAVDHAADAIPDALLSALAGPRRAIPKLPDEICEAPPRAGFLRRLLSVFWRRRRT